MIFAQTNRYAKRQNVFSADDRQGASVAHAELLRAVLRHSTVQGAELFVAGSPKRAPPMNSEFIELCREFPQKSLRLRNFDELPTLDTESQHVFCTSGVFVSPLAQARRSAGKSFPICAFSHAIDIPLILLFFPGAFLLASEHDAIITSSKAGKTALMKLAEMSRELAIMHFGKGFPIGCPRIEVIPLGVDTDLIFPRDRASAREVLGLPVNGAILLYAGRLSEDHKADLEPLLIVLRELLRKTPDVVLLMAGHDQDNSYVGELEGMALRLGVRSNVRFLLNFQDFLKPFVYSASDILVSPSDNIQETFGLSIIEAMACGLPVVASDWSGYRDLVVHGRTGFLVPTLWNSHAADSVSAQAPLLSDGARRHMISQQTAVLCPEMYQYIDALLGNAVMRANFGAEGRCRATSLFSWKHVIDMHEALWRDLWDQVRNDRVALSGPTLIDDWDFAFRHFATACISLDTLVRRSAMRSDIDDALRYRTGKPGYDDIEHSELHRIVERASIEPVSVRQLLLDKVASDTRSIMWLIKKGYLRLAETIVEIPSDYRVR